MLRTSPLSSVRAKRPYKALYKALLVRTELVSLVDTTEWRILTGSTKMEGEGGGWTLGGTEFFGTADYKGKHRH